MGSPNRIHPIKSLKCLKIDKSSSGYHEITLKTDNKVDLRGNPRDLKT